MGLNCGIVGLPNVGKSTLFQAITSAPAEIANYPFCTIDPNVGIVEVPDSRMDEICKRIPPQKIIPAIVEFVDIAGLVKGASKGEGLGNQFLGHIKQVGAIIHVVRCFDDPNIIHVHGKVNPAEDISTINYELALADLETVTKRLYGIDKLIKSLDKKTSTQSKIAKPVLEKLKDALERGLQAREVEMEPQERESIFDLHLITMKPVLYACNVDEECLLSGNQYVEQVKAIASSQGAKVVIICAKIESEVAALETKKEKEEFLNSLGVEESGLKKLIRDGYTLLDLETYFTAGEKEVRAWTFEKNMKAPQAAGIIHTDFEKGFIKAEIYHYNDLVQYGTEQKVKEAGKLRIEGKEYVVKDGDIVHFRFNV